MCSSLLDYMAKIRHVHIPDTYLVLYYYVWMFFGIFYANYTDTRDHPDLEMVTMDDFCHMLQISAFGCTCGFLLANLLPLLFMSAVVWIPLACLGRFMGSVNLETVNWFEL